MAIDLPTPHTGGEAGGGEEEGRKDHELAGAGTRHRVRRGDGAEPELSAPLLAGKFNVSVRTLQRAFAATGESVTAYIRRRRLEEAGRALIAPAGAFSVSELAAHWQFADSSHFTRAFKLHFGQTPTEYARRSRL